MFCINCGREIDDNTKFCPYCGSRIDDIEFTGMQAEKSGERNPVDTKGSKTPKWPWIVIAVLILSVIIGGILLWRSGMKKEEALREEEAENEEEETEEKEPETKSVSEYEIVLQRMTWSEAETYCEERGGHLAVITSQEEYDTVIMKASQYNVPVLWVGGSRSGDGFSWTTGEPFSFSAWAAGEPNNDGGSENRIGLMQVKGSWAMYDMPEDVSAYYSADKVGFIMEIETEVYE